MHCSHWDELPVTVWMRDLSRSDSALKPIGKAIQHWLEAGLAYLSLSRSGMAEANSKEGHRRIVDPRPAIDASLWAPTSGSGAVSGEKVKMNVWHDMWPELSVLLFLLFWTGALVVTLVLTW